MFCLPSLPRNGHPAGNGGSTQRRDVEKSSCHTPGNQLIIIHSEKDKLKFLWGDDQP